eukprot:gene11940-biopygen13287
MTTTATPEAATRSTTAATTKGAATATATRRRKRARWQCGHDGGGGDDDNEGDNHNDDYNNDCNTLLGHNTAGQKGEERGKGSSQEDGMSGEEFDIGTACPLPRAAARPDDVVRGLDNRGVPRRVLLQAQDPRADHLAAHLPAVREDAREAEEQVVAWVEAVPERGHHQRQRDAVALDAERAEVPAPEVDALAQPIVDAGVPVPKRALDSGSVEGGEGRRHRGGSWPGTEPPSSIPPASSPLSAARWAPAPRPAPFPAAAAVGRPTRLPARRRPPPSHYAAQVYSVP